MSDAIARTPGRGLHITLWILQVVLAALFCFAGFTKLVMSEAELTQNTSLPIAFIRFIGVCELLGGLGLVLPGLFKIKTWLTPLAAAGLVIIMIGATVITLMGEPKSMAALPFVFLLLLLVVAWGRWKAAPL